VSERELTVSYVKPILIEIYSETHFESGSFPPDQFFDVVPRLKEIGFSEVEIGEVGLIAVDAEEQQVTHSNVPRIRCWTKDRSRLVQLSEDVVVVNLVGEYPGWDAFRDLFSSAHDTLPDPLVSRKVESLSLNTIDRLRVPRQGYRLGRYLACGGKFLPEWYSESTEAVDITLGRGILQEDGFNRQFRFKVRVKAEVSAEIRSTFHDLVQAQLSLHKALEKLHDESSRAFEEMITNETRHSVMGGEKSYANNR
jgi:uncharacterized protein (TIGR04255 family)